MSAEPGGIHPSADCCDTPARTFRGGATGHSTGRPTDYPPPPTEDSAGRPGAMPPASVRPLDRSTALPSATALPPTSLCAAKDGAYVLAGDRWVALPRNNGRVVQSTAPALDPKLAGLTRREDATAGKPTNPPPAAFAQLSFDGPDWVPVIPARNLVIAYVGHLAPISPERLARHPELKTYPPIELAPEQTLTTGVRYTPLVPIAPGLMGFGPARVLTATVEQISIRPPDHSADRPITLLRATVPIPRGRYALSCGTDYYEVVVE